jgi:hypothetical protein
MVYRLLRQDARDQNWKAMFVDGVSLDALWAGLPISEPSSSISITLGPWGREESDFLEQPCVIVSEAMRRALDGAGVDNIQYLRASVRMQYVNAAFPDLWIGNVIGTVSCLDEEAAAAAAAAGGVQGGFQVDPTRAGGFGLFRLAEDRRLIVIGDRVAQTLRAAGLRGMVLQDTLSYTGAPVSTAPVEPQEVGSG